MFYIVYERKIPCSIFQNLCTVKMQFLEPISTECKKSSVGASREEIFQFNWRIAPENNDFQLPKEHVWAYTDYKID